jgi:hypothetical protein
MSLSVLAQPRAPRAAFGKIVRNEARLAWRQPSGLIVGVGISLALLIIFGEIPVFRQSSASLGGLSAFDVYIPILIACVRSAPASLLRRQDPRQGARHPDQRGHA